MIGSGIAHSRVDPDVTYVVTHQGVKLRVKWPFSRRKLSGAISAIAE